MNNWYIYRHIRLDKNEPFYIGIGNKKDYARAYESHVSKRNSMWIKIYNKTSIEVDIILEGLTKEEASIKEKEFIKMYGRKDLNSGTLCNLTDGGDGIWNCLRSEETRKKLREKSEGSKNHRFGTKQSEETKIKRGIYTKGRVSTDEKKRKQSISSVDSGQAKITEVFDKKTGKSVGIYHSMSEACRAVGLIPSKYSGKASMVARGLRNQCKGYIFKYITSITNGSI